MEKNGTMEPDLKKMVIACYHGFPVPEVKKVITISELVPVYWIPYLGPGTDDPLQVDFQKESIRMIPLDLPDISVQAAGYGPHSQTLVLYKGGSDGR